MVGARKKIMCEEQLVDPSTDYITKEHCEARLASI